MAAEREFRVVAISGDAADQHRLADDVHDELRTGQLEVVDARRELEALERVLVAVAQHAFIVGRHGVDVVAHAVQDDVHFGQP
jgi:hypothetical protein